MFGWLWRFLRRKGKEIDEDERQTRDLLRAIREDWIVRERFEEERRKRRRMEYEEEIRKRKIDEQGKTYDWGTWEESGLPFRFRLVPKASAEDKARDSDGDDTDYGSSDFGNDDSSGSDGGTE